MLLDTIKKCIAQKQQLTSISKFRIFQDSNTLAFQMSSLLSEPFNIMKILY